MTTSQQFIFNGVNGATGRYLYDPAQLDDIAAVAGHSEIGSIPSGPKRRPIASVNPKKITEAGWGIIFPAGEDNSEILNALAPLLALREMEAGRLYRLYDGAEGYRTAKNETKSSFLRRHKVSGGPVNPEQMPYYLLLVGSPESIPFEFQAQLDVQFAVGRIHFETVEEYANYAQSVVQAEQRDIVLSKRISFFGTQNPDDLATELSTTQLVQPLVARMEELKPAWNIEQIDPLRATKERLRQLLSSPSPPAILFTASHGVGFPKGDSRQLPHQGALICQDWPGPETWRGPIPDKFYFSADDLSDDANVAGMIGFNFACYSGGTPQYDQYDFDNPKSDHGEEIALRPFLARLPQRLLSHPRGGALAVINHIDRAWSYSFRAPGVDAQIQTFESTLGELIEGFPVGHALAYFNERYAELATELNKSNLSLLRPRLTRDGSRSGGLVDSSRLEIVGQWTAYNDARDYMLFGDPAVRLPIEPKVTILSPESIETDWRRERLYPKSQSKSRATTVPPAEIQPANDLQAESFSDSSPSELSVSTYVGDDLLIQTKIYGNGQAENRLPRQLLASDNHSVTLHQKTLAEIIKAWRS